MAEQKVAVGNIVTAKDGLGIVVYRIKSVWERDIVQDLLGIQISMPLKDKVIVWWFGAGHKLESDTTLTMQSGDNLFTGYSNAIVLEGRSAFRTYVWSVHNGDMQLATQAKATIMHTAALMKTAVNSPALLFARELNDVALSAQLELRNLLDDDSYNGYSFNVVPATGDAQHTAGLQITVSQVVTQKLRQTFAAGNNGKVLKYRLEFPDKRAMILGKVKKSFPNGWGVKWQVVSSGIDVDNLKQTRRSPGCSYTGSRLAGVDLNVIESFSYGYARGEDALFYDVILQFRLRADAAISSAALIQLLVNTVPQYMRHPVQA